METPTTSPSSLALSLPHPDEDADSAHDTPALSEFSFSPPVQDADVVLITTDDEELHAHTLILRRASSVLAACIASSTKAPRIHIPAPAHIVDLLLTHLYPDFSPDIDSLDELLSLIQLCVTYQITSLITRLRKQLVSPRFLHAHPVRIYAAASLWSLQAETELAGEASGAVDLASLAPSDLTGVSAVDYVRLVRLHKRRRTELTQAIEKWLSHRCKTCQHSNSWAAQYRQRALAEIQRRPSARIILGEEFMARNAVAGVCATCDVHWAFMEGWKELQSMCMPGKITYFVPPSRTVSPTETNTSSIASTPAFDQGDVVLRSSDGVSLHAWRRILSESSPFFRALFDLPQQDTFPADSPECDSSLPVIDCQEDTSTLTSLLQLIYPLPNPTFLTIDELVPALEAAHKYDVPSAVSTLVTLLRSRKLLASDPVRVYALAQRYTLPSLSRAAASACLHTDLDDTSESSVLHLSASAFTRLLAWRNAHSQAIRKALTDTPFAYTCGVCRERWTARWLTLALYEVARRPVGEVIFSWEFILQAMDMERPASVGGHYVSGFGTGPTAATWGGVAVGSGHYCANAVTEGDREWMRALNMRVADLEEEMPEMMVS